MRENRRGNPETYVRVWRYQGGNRNP